MAKPFAKQKDYQDWFLEKKETTDSKMGSE